MNMSKVLGVDSNQNSEIHRKSNEPKVKDVTRSQNPFPIALIILGIIGLGLTACGLAGLGANQRIHSPIS